MGNQVSASTYLVRIGARCFHKTVSTGRNRKQRNKSSTVIEKSAALFVLNYVQRVSTARELHKIDDRQESDLESWKSKTVPKIYVVRIFSASVYPTTNAIYVPSISKVIVTTRHVMLRDRGNDIV